MYPQFLDSFFVGNAVPENSSAARLGRTLGIGYATNLASGMRAALRRRDANRDLRTTLLELWARALFVQITRVLLRNRVPQYADALAAPLTPAEIELTKKAALLGMQVEDIYKLPLQRDGTESTLPSGRFRTLVDFVIEEALSRASEAESDHKATYWLLFAAPGEVERPAVRNKTFSEISPLGLVGLSAGHQLMVTLFAEKRSPVTAIPQFVYAGASGTRFRHKGIMAAFHVEDARKCLPKGPFTFNRGDWGMVFGFTGKHTVMVTDRKMDSDVKLTAIHFPCTFAGPHPLARFERAIEVLGSAINYTFSVDPSEIAALLSVRCLSNPFDDEPYWGREGNTNHIQLSPELACGLTFDRGVHVYLSGTEDDNAQRIRRLLDRYTTDLGSK